MKISYAILTHNEGDYIPKLLSFLTKNIRKEDEIIVVDDFSTDKTTLDALEYYDDKINLYQRKFDGDASQKNYLNSKCTGNYILQLDADEIMLKEFIHNLPSILENNKVDVFYLPRINTVNGLTQEHIKKWGWNINEKGWVNFPDYQMRLYRNCKEVKWEGLLHSKIVGFKTYIALPTDNELFCMIHLKEISRQEEQNNLYDQIEANGRTKYKINDK